MQLIVVLLLLAVAANANFVKHLLSSKQTRGSPETCTAYSCAASGNVKCGAISNTSFVLCPDDYYCSTAGTCDALVGAGGACGYNTGFCSFPLQCEGGVCTTVTYNATIGEPCVGTSQCLANLHCARNGTCIALPTNGQACDNVNGCGGICFCSSTNSTCAPYFGTPVGGSCTSSLECTPGNVCNGGICAPPAASSNTPCSSSTDCRQDESCNCPLSTTATTATCTVPYSYTKAQASAIIALVTCMQANSCTSLEPCLECKSSICEYYGTVTSAVFDKDLIKCIQSSGFIGCSSSSSPSPSLVTSLVFLLLGAVVAVL